jgi:hypothetical protein
MGGAFHEESTSDGSCPLGMCTIPKLKIFITL